MTQYFWKRWTADYLNQLQVRSKWTKESNESLKPNDLVLIKDENLPPTQWLTGRVTETHPGADGLTRVVTLKTKDSKMKRPVTKLCPLPINNCNEIIDPQPTEVSVETPNENDEGVRVKANIARVTARRNKSLGILPIITAILAICTTFSHQTSSKNDAFEITTFNASPGIYFEKTHDVYT